MLEKSWNFEERRAEPALGASKVPNPSLGSKKCGWKPTILERLERAIVEAKHSGHSCISAARRRPKKHSKERSMLDGISLTVTPVSQMAQDRSWGGRHGGELDQTIKPCLEKHRCGRVPLGSSRFQCN